MAEISRAFKIVILIGVITDFTFSIFYIFLPDIYYTFIPSPWYDLAAARIVGLIFFTFGCCGTLAIKRAEWEQLRLYVEFGIVFLTLLMILNIALALDPSLAPYQTLIFSYWIIAAMSAGFVFSNLYFYLKEQKKS